MKKEHFEILLENMDSKFDLVLEGHAALDKKIEDLRQENKEEHNLLQQMITEVNRKIDNVQQENETAHKEILSGIKLSYSELDSRIKFLEQELSGLNQRVTRLEAARH